MTKVKWIYNHIRGISSVSINGKPVLAQSRLEESMRMPFSYWYKELLETIYSVTLEEFQLEFCGRTLECMILQEQKRFCQQCIELKFSKPDFDVATMERLKYLKRIVGEIPHEKIQIEVYTDQTNCIVQKDSVIASLGDIPLCDISYEVYPLEQVVYRATQGQGIRLLFLYQTRPEELSLQGLSKLQGHTYIMSVFKGSANIGVSKGIYLDNFVQGEEIEKIQKWLGYECLPQTLNRLLEKVECNPQTDTGLSLCMLNQVTAQTFVVPCAVVEPEEKVKLQTRSYPPSCVAKLEYVSKKPEVIKICGEQLCGGSLGVSTIEVYSMGCPVPIQQMQIQCARLVQKLYLEKEEIYIVKDTRAFLKARYEPQGAVNAEDIEYRSSNPDTVMVNPKTGEVLAKQIGEAIITVSVRGVRASCMVKIRPALQEIVLEPEKISVVVGQKHEFFLRTIPEDAIPSDYHYTCSGNGEVIIDEECRTIEGVSAGTVDIRVSQQNGTVEGYLQVKVKNAFDFRIFGVLAVVAAAVGVIAKVFRILFL